MGICGDNGRWSGAFFLQQIYLHLPFVCKYIMAYFHGNTSVFAILQHHKLCFHDGSVGYQEDMNYQQQECNQDIMDVHGTFIGETLGRYFTDLYRSLQYCKKIICCHQLN